MILSLFFFSSFSQQKYLPEIKTGTLFQYEFKGKDGTVLIVNGAVTSTDKNALAFVDTLKFNGKFQVYKTVISKTAMDKADKMKPPKDESTSTSNGVSLFVLSDDKTDHCFSRHFFKTIKEQKSATYGGITYNLTDMTANNIFKLDDREVDAIYIVSANGQKKFWILNNPMYPFILKSSSENVNALLTGISNN